MILSIVANILLIIFIAGDKSYLLWEAAPVGC